MFFSQNTNNCDYVVMFPAGANTKASGHSGILESAKAVLEDLQSTGVLQRLMQQPPVGHWIARLLVEPI